LIKAPLKAQQDTLTGEPVAHNHSRKKAKKKKKKKKKKSTRRDLLLFRDLLSIYSAPDGAKPFKLAGNLGPCIDFDL
jgi:hypothetical protein